MKKHNFTVALALVTLSCAKPPPDTSPDLKVLTGEAAAEVLRQCSREVPQHEPNYWQPAISDALAMERLLPATLRENVPERDWSGFPAKWGRRYVGIIRRGKRFIYGDYFPAGIGDVCDGGARFFGAEYDVQTGKISQLEFNGVG